MLLRGEGRGTRTFFEVAVEHVEGEGVPRYETQVLSSIRGFREAVSKVALET